MLPHFPCCKICTSMTAGIAEVLALGSWFRNFSHLMASTTTTSTTTSGVHSGGLRLQGKVAVITGGASGIGEATVKLFAAQGAKVIIADIKDAEGEKVAQEVGGSGVARYIHCDVTKEEQIAAAVDLSVSAFGGLDIMYNNAGIIGPMGPIDKTPTEELDFLYSVLVRGAFLGIKHAARVMKPLQKGSIITTASVAGHAGGHSTHAYTTFKHALVGLTRSAAFELRNYQIRVNAISPGGVLTNLWTDLPPDAPNLMAHLFAKQGLASALTVPDNIASAALFLASDDAAYVSGHCLVVDGSHMVSPESPHSVLFFR
ncbi:hypothetical protein Mapa_015574 [Marchantia paleacea]|nr:hypothetical protein Mapa_015574 [Marchantia paleacea]